jgi:hypothetical protein
VIAEELEEAVEIELLHGGLHLHAQQVVHCLEILRAVRSDVLHQSSE